MLNGLYQLCVFCIHSHILVEKPGSNFLRVPNLHSASLDSPIERYSCKIWKLEGNTKQLFTSGSCEQAHGCHQWPTLGFTKNSLLSSAKSPFSIGQADEIFKDSLPAPLVLLYFLRASLTFTTTGLPMVV